MRVCDLERALFARFPREDAEPWDHVGLSVGDPAAPVAGVCCALDATAEHVRACAEAGANVLVTHHPVYLDAPAAFTPAARERPAASTAVFEAARLGVSILSFHTNLDRSREARDALPALVGLEARSSLEHAGDPEARGLGALCEGPGIALGDFAARVAEAFGTEPRVWGEPDRVLGRIAFLGGSLGGFGDSAISHGADAIVTGEAGYHRAQDLALRGLAVIELGHDRSEEPFCAILADAVAEAGIARDRTRIIAGRRQWWTASPRR